MLFDSTYRLMSDAVFSGMGRVSVKKGSKVIDSFPQSGQMTFDLYCPIMLSLMIDWFLLI